MTENSSKISLKGDGKKFIIMSKIDKNSSNNDFIFSTALSAVSINLLNPSIKPNIIFYHFLIILIVAATKIMINITIKNVFI